MKITPITSENNTLLKMLRALHLRQHREKSGLFLIEGSKLINEAYTRNVQVQNVLVSKSYLESGAGKIHTGKLTEILVLEDKLFREQITTDTSCGIIALAKIPQWSPKDLFKGKSALVLIAQAIQDPGNLGTMIRTALAANASGIILTKGTVDAFNPKVVRSAAGALFTLPILADLTADESIACAREHGLKIIACEPQASKLYWEVDMTGPVALLFGNEGQGFSGSVLANSDLQIAIPMDKASESLNVSISAGIILFSAVQQRQLKA